MTDVLKAASEARRFLAGFKAIDTVAAAFEDAGSVLRAAEEARVQLDAARAELSTLQSAAASARESVAKAKKDAAGLVADASEKAKDAKAAAEAEAAAIAATARQEAADIVAQADQHRQAALDAVDVLGADRDRLADEVKDLEERVEKARAYIAKLKE